MTSEDDQALLERLAKREERRQRRMREALERQREFDPTITDGEATLTTTTTGSSEDRSSRRSRLRNTDEDAATNEVPSPETNSWTEKKEKNRDENEEETVKEEHVPEPASEETKDTQEDIVEKNEDEKEAERSQRSYLRAQVILSKICKGFYICMNWECK